jgi:hypothetical protein
MTIEIEPHENHHTVGDLYFKMQIYGDNNDIDDFINAANHNDYAKGLLYKDLVEKEYINTLSQWGPYKSIFFDLLIEDIKLKRRKVDLLKEKFRCSYYCDTPEELSLVRHPRILDILDKDPVLKDHIKSKFNLKYFKNADYPSYYYCIWKEEATGSDAYIMQEIKFITDKVRVDWSAKSDIIRRDNIISFLCNLTTRRFPILFWKLLANKFYNLTFKVTTDMYDENISDRAKGKWYKREYIFHKKEAYYIDKK